MAFSIPSWNLGSLIVGGFMFLINSVDLSVVICVIVFVVLVIFLRFILPKIKAKKVKNVKHKLD